MATPMTLRANSATTKVGQATRTTNRLIWAATLAILAEYAVTCIHHVYGGLVYGSPGKLITPLIFAPPLALTLALLHRYVRTRSSDVLTLFGVTSVALWVLVLGTFEGGYNHTTKLTLFFMGVPPALLQSFFPAYEYVLPNDFVFEATGVLTLVAAYFTALETYRLVLPDVGRRALRQAVAVAAGLGVLTVLVDGPLLILYTNTFELSYLVPVGLLLGLGVVAFAMVRFLAISAPTSSKSNHLTRIAISANCQRVHTLPASTTHGS